LTAVWHATGTLGKYGTAVRLLILTAARRAEIFALRWSEIDLAAGAINLPAGRNKVGQARRIHLSPMAVELLAALPRDGPFVFGRSGRSTFGGSSYAKRRLDREAAVADWRLHDLRRTVATGLQRMGCRFP
jgi:integrase